MPTETITVGDLVGRTLDILHRHTERPQTRAVSGVTSTQLTMADTLGLATGTLLEATYELLRVSSVSGTTVNLERAYGGTPSAGNAFTSVAKDPLWARHSVVRAISDHLAGLYAQVPLVKNAEVTVAEGRQFIDLTALPDFWTPIRVGFFSATTGAFIDLPGWEFVDDIAAAAFPGVTRLLTLPGGLVTGEKVTVTYRALYTGVSYTTPNDAATVTVPLGARDLPALGAAARLLSNREVSRAEIDRVEEWTQEAAIRGGWTLRAVNQLWQEYYRRVDEVSRAVKETLPKHRPYRKMRGQTWRKVW